MRWLASWHQFLRRGASAAVLATVALASAIAPATTASAHTTPHSTPTISHVYTVNTFTDVLLNSSAPAHECQDQGDAAQCSLRAAIAVVNNDFDGTPNVWDEIKLPQGTFKLNPSVSTSPLTVEYAGSLTVTGVSPGKSIIDASTLGFDSTVFEGGVSGVSLELSDLEIEGGAAEAGAQVDLATGDALDATECAFSDGAATINGGAIYAASGSSVDVGDSQFVGFSAVMRGGAIDDESDTTLIVDGDNFQLSSTSDSDPSSTGGAIYAAGDVYAIGDGFADDVSDGDGGAIYAGGNVTVEDSVFAHTESLGGDGGAIFANGAANVINCQFQYISAGSSGGALEITNGGNVNGDEFESDSSGLYGGDIDSYGAVDVVDSTSRGSTSAELGGSIYGEPNSGLSIDDSTFTDDSVTGALSGDGGGAIAASEATVSINNSSFFGAEAPNGDANGGATFCHDCSLTAQSPTIVGSTAASDGGALYLDGGSATIIGGVLDGGHAGWGGAIAITSGGTVLATAVTMAANVASLDGGAIFDNSSGHLTLNASTLSADKANATSGYGGAVDLDETGGSLVATLTDDTFEGDGASTGGALYVDQSSTSILSSTIALNTAASGAGNAEGIDVVDGTVTATDSILTGVGQQCASTSGSLVSGGFNLTSDGSCGFTAIGDRVSTAADLGVLQNNGGTTETMAPASGSPAIGTGGDACTAVDQRGDRVPAGDPCDIGSVFVLGTTTALRINPTTLTWRDEQRATITITVTADTGVLSPKGTVTVVAGQSGLCHATLVPVLTSLTKSTATCTTGASRLAVGHFAAGATYAGIGIFATSRSGPVRLTVVHAA